MYNWDQLLKPTDLHTEVWTKKKKKQFVQYKKKQAHFQKYNILVYQ